MNTNGHATTSELGTDKNTKTKRINQAGNQSWKRASKTCAGTKQEDEGAVAAVEVVDGGKALLAADRTIQPLIAEAAIAQIVLRCHGDDACMVIECHGDDACMAKEIRA